MPPCSGLAGCEVPIRSIMGQTSTFEIRTSSGMVKNGALGDLHTGIDNKQEGEGQHVLLGKERWIKGERSGRKGSAVEGEGWF